MKSTRKEKRQFVPRIILKFHDQISMPYKTDDEVNNYFLEHQIVSWSQMLKNFPGISVSRLFTTVEPTRILEMTEKAKNRDKSYDPPNFLTYFAINLPDKFDRDELLKKIWEDKNIEYAYKECGLTDPPTVDASDDRSSKWQGYLKPAPLGIDAMFAWKVPGGDGNSTVKFIDIELGWWLDHVDLPIPPIQIISGKSFDYCWHGTGVLGIIMAQDNDSGCVGITPNIKNLKAAVISQARPTIGNPNREIHTTNDEGKLVHNTAEAIMDAIQHLDFGDVLLLKSQVFLNRGLSDSSTSNYPSEVEYAIFEVISLATAKGIIVIEAAGNGSLETISLESIGQNLDLFQDDSSKFVFDRNNISDFKDSGAIIVGGSSSVTPHTKETSSNFGNRIDCYAWGENIKTTGNANAVNSRTGYTSDFSGTSGASAIIAGAVISIQSMLEAAGKLRIGPNQMREILRKKANGTESESAADNIGVMPDLKKIFQNEISVV